MGPRGVGKTTYLATLVAFPHQQRFPGYQIEPKSPPTEDLVVMAENLLKKGLQPPPSDEAIEYQFDVTIPATKNSIATKLELLTVDHTGEIFQHLAEPHKWDKVKDYVDDFLTAQGWMVMVTDWDIHKDISLYKPAFQKLWEQLEASQKKYSVIGNLRIAVVMAKCERGELWTGRLEPGEDLFKVRLPKTYHFLMEKFSSDRLQFFACSAFGVLGSRNPRPNRKYLGSGQDIDSDAAILRKPAIWNPYGILAPIYWLSTGRFLDGEL